MAKSITPNMTAEKTVGKRSGQPVTKIRPKKPAAPAGPQPRADINGWVLCPGDNVLIIDPPKGEHHGLFAKVDAFPTTLELSSYVQLDGRPSNSGRVLMPCDMLRWMGPDETLIDRFRPTRPGERVRVVLDNEALASAEMKALEGKLGTVTELMPTVNGNSMVTVKLDDPAELPTAINSFDLLVVPIPVVQYVPEPEEALVATEPLRLTTAAWDLLESIVALGAHGHSYQVETMTTVAAEIAELAQAGLIEIDAFASGTAYRATLTGMEFLDIPEESLPAPTEQPAELERLSVVATVQEIPLTDIDTSRNYRKVFDDASLAELAQSIEAHGIMQPVMVRPTPAGQNALPYQLVYGGRRYRGAQLAGLTVIPATVRELSELQFAEAQLIENVQRQDVRPSDEAKAFHDLLSNHKLSPEEVALKVGRPLKFVLQRAKLVALIPFWMEMLEAERLPLASAHELARLPAHSQMDVKRGAKSWFYGEAPIYDVSRMRSLISNVVLRDLTNVHFPLDDATLHAPAGACLTCPKRSGANQVLFEDDAEKDRCLDAGCFTTKRSLFVERRLSELTKEDGRPPVLAFNDQALRKERGGIADWQYVAHKERQKDSQRILHMDGRDAGKDCWGKVSSSAEPQTPEQKEAEKAKRREELRQNRISEHYRLLLTASMAQGIAQLGCAPKSVLMYHASNELRSEGGPHKALQKFLVDNFNFKLPEGGIGAKGFDGGKRSAWVNENLQQMTDPELCGLYFAMQAYNRSTWNLDRLEKQAQEVGAKPANLKKQAAALEPKTDEKGAKA